jgi:hypothetical protein
MALSSRIQPELPDNSAQKDIVKRLLLCFYLLWCQVAVAAPAAELAPTVRVIAHPSVRVDALSQAQLRSIYLMRQVVWPDGVAIRVFTLAPRSAVNLQFCRDHLQLFPYQLERVWQKLTYSGTGTPPTELQDQQAMLQAIAATPGAIGYIGIQDETQVVKVIPIRP